MGVGSLKKITQEMQFIDPAANPRDGLLLKNSYSARKHKDPP